jgi:hypothetical protein
VCLSLDALKAEATRIAPDPAEFERHAQEVLGVIRAVASRSDSPTP